MPPGAGCISGMWGGWHGWGADIDLHLDSVWKSANSMGHNKRKIKVKEGQKLYNKLYTEMKLLQRGWAKLKAGGKRGLGDVIGGFAGLLVKLKQIKVGCASVSRCFETLFAS